MFNLGKESVENSKSLELDYGTSYDTSTYGSSYGSSYGSGLSGGLAGSGGGIQPGVLLTVGVISLITAIVLFIVVVQRKKSFKSRFANWVKEYLNFRSILIAGIIKFLFLFSSIFLTIMSIIVMFQGKGDDVLPMILTGLAMLTLGNLLLRVLMELTMAMIMVWENTSDIRLVLVKRDETLKDEKNPQKTKETVDEKQSRSEEPVVEAEARKPEAPRPEAVRPEVRRHQAPEASDAPKPSETK